MKFKTENSEKNNTPYSDAVELNEFIQFSGMLGLDENGLVEGGIVPETQQIFKNLKAKFANPRIAASGSLRQINPEDTKKIPLKFIAYTFGYKKGLKIKKQTEFLDKLSSWGFKTNPFNKLIIARPLPLKDSREYGVRSNRIDNFLFRIRLF